MALYKCVYYYIIIIIIKVSVNVIAEYILAGLESKVRVSVKVIPCDNDCIMFIVVNKLRANTVRFPSSHK